MGTRPLLSKTLNRAGHDPKHQREMIMSTMATPLSLIMYIFFPCCQKRKQKTTTTTTTTMIPFTRLYLVANKLTIAAVDSIKISNSFSTTSTILLLTLHHQFPPPHLLRCCINCSAQQYPFHRPTCESGLHCKTI
jgi:hypothetical protein